MLPSVIYFRIDASAKDCALALAHLVLPSLTRLQVDVKSFDREGEDALLVIPYVFKEVYVLQDIEPIRSILIAGGRASTEVLTWTTPGDDVKACSPDTLDDMTSSTCLLFSAKGHLWREGVQTEVFDALLTLLPVNSVSTLTTQNRTRLSKEFWLKHASRLSLLEQARLYPTAVRGFKEMLAEYTPLDLDGPRLPMLTKLILLNVGLNEMGALHLGDMLIERVERGVPLEYLDLRTCVATNRAIQLLAETVVDVQELPDKSPMEMADYFNREEYDREVKFKGPWYDEVDDVGEDEDEDD